MCVLLPWWQTEISVFFSVSDHSLCHTPNCLWVQCMSCSNYWFAHFSGVFTWAPLRLLIVTRKGRRKRGSKCWQLYTYFKCTCRERVETVCMWGACMHSIIFLSDENDLFGASRWPSHGASHTITRLLIFHSNNHFSPLSTIVISCWIIFQI